MTVQFELNDYERKRIVDGEQERDKAWPDFVYTFENVISLVRTETGENIMLCKNQFGEIWTEQIPWKFRISIVVL